MRHIIHEIHRRSLWQVLGIYLAASWVALQVVNEIGDTVGLPPWVSPAALALLVLGFPVVLATTLVQHRPAAGPSAPVGSEGSAPRPEAAPSATAEGPSGPGGVEGTPAVAVHHRLFTWRNAVLGGVGAFAVLGLGAGGWMALRAAGIGPAGTLVAKGALEDRALVILADFESEDAEIGGAATEALRVDLSQSDVIRLAEPALISEALERMGRDPSEPLTREVAEELAVREGAGALVTGEVISAGAGHVLSASVVSAKDGAVLTAQRESASGDDDIIPAIDRLSEKLRERIGDSYRSMRADPPLERVTTSSLEALELYSRSQQPGADRGALLEQAVALDSGFAMAWRALGILYSNRNVEPARTIYALTRAFEERDRLTAIERHKVVAMYYTRVEFDPARATVEHQALLELAPEDASTLVNLGALRSMVGDHAGSNEFALRAIEADPENLTGYWNAITSSVNVGRIDEAEALVDSMAVKFGPNPSAELMVRAAQGRLDELDETWHGFVTQAQARPGPRARMALNLAAFASAHGRANEAETETRRRTEWLLERGNATEYLETVSQAAWTDLSVRQRPDLAVARLDEALARTPLDEMEPLDRPYLELAELLARAGRPDRARALVDEMQEAGAAVPRQRQYLRQVEGEIALAEGRPDEAIERFQGTFAQFCSICPLPGLALAYEAAGQPDSAIAAHRRYVETPFSDRFLPYTYRQGQLLGPEYERLAELYDEQGDLENAVRFYAAFVDLWEGADEELQPRVRAAQARLQQIVETRG